jgi:acyl transferase domain-containing protein/non-ribosomal peptide synthetase component F/SAM-dependent methyltransferase
MRALKKYIFEEVKSGRLSVDKASGLLVHIDNASAADPLAQPMHPLLHRNTSDLQGQRYSSVFSGEEFFLLGHQVQGRRVLPGSAHLEMARAALMDATGASAVCLEAVEFVRPLVVGAEGMRVDIGVSEEEGGATGFEIYGRVAGQEEELVYSRGRGRVVEGVACEQLDLALLGTQCVQGPWSGEACYAAFEAMGLKYGASHRGLGEVRAGRDEAGRGLVLARLAPAPEQGYVLHPGVLDSALQASIGLVLGSEQGAAGLRMPTGIRRVQVHGTTKEVVYAVVRAPALQQGVQADTLDIELVDEQGQVCVRLEGFMVREVGRGVVRGDEPARPAPQPVRPGQETGPVMSLTGELTLVPVWDPMEEPQGPCWPGAGQRLVAVDVSAAQEQALRACCGALQVIHIDEADGIEQIGHKLRSCGEIEHLLWSVAPALDLALGSERLIDVQQQGVRRGLRLVKALQGQGHDRRALGLTVVTHQVQSVGAEDVVHPAHASVHGLIGSLAKEMSHWQIRLLDVPAQEPWPLQQMLRIEADPHGNARVYRQGQWHAQGLLSCRMPEPGKSVYRSGGVYVILGGAGGLGGVLSEHLLVEHQAQVVWLGRREEDAVISAKRQRLGQLGPMPQYIAVDAADRAALQEAGERIVQEFGAVHGLVHASLVLKDQSLASMDEAGFVAALQAKVDTSVNMAAVFGGQALDFVLFFSSLQSMGKMPGQSNYAAGCTFVDAYAQALRQSWGSPAKVVNWGYWGQHGAVASPVYRERMAQSGMGSIEPPQAMRVLRQLLESPVPQLVFMQTTRAEVARVLQVSGEQGMEVLAQKLVAPVQPHVVALPRLPMDAEKVAQQEQQDFEALLVQLLWSQLKEMGLFAQPEQALSAWWQQSGAVVSGEYERWLGHSLDILQARGYVEVQDQTVRVLPVEVAPMAALWAKWEQHKPAWLQDRQRGAQVRLLDAVLPVLGEVLSGRRAATAVMFPHSSMVLVEGVYKDNPIADYFNEVLGQTLQAHVKARVEADPQVQLRMLEIGAGTGGTSATVLRQLAPWAQYIADYSYTDLSQAFLQHAKQHYQAQSPYLSTRLFNVEMPLRAQGVEPGSYDVVIAANVLHATRDIRQTLRNAKALLKRQGVLLLNELTDSSVFTHLSFGLLQGWWLYRDAPLRAPGSPALRPATWARVLQAEGFAPVQQMAPQAHPLGQQIILAHSDGVVRQATPLIDSGGKPGAACLEDRKSTAPTSPRLLALRSPGQTREQMAEGARRYLTQLVADTMKISPREIEAHVGFDRYGIDSIIVVELTERIQKVFPRLESTVFFEYNHIDALAEHLLALRPDEFAAVLGVASTPDPRPIPATETSLTARGAPVTDTVGREGLLAGTISYLQRFVAKILEMNPDDLEVTRPLETYGLDSILSMKLVDGLRELLGEVDSTIFFRYQTVEAIAGHLVDHRHPGLNRLGGVAAQAAKPGANAPRQDMKNRTATTSARVESAPLRATAPNALSLPVQQPIAIVAMSGRYPEAATLEAYWDNLSSGRDCVIPIPGQRWDSDFYLSPGKATPGKSICAHGGFIEGVDEFDAELFGVAPADARLMDPQTRLFLQTVWALLERAGYTPDELAKQCHKRVGLYVGAMYQQYRTEKTDPAEESMLMLSSYGGIANRVSHFFGFEGPSMAIDTMCSSSAMAVHLACRALEAGDCEVAIAGGVNLSIHPHKYVGLSQLGLLGSRIDRRSFSDSDGFIPAEGVGAVLLKPLHRALADRDRVWGVITGSASVHGGGAANYAVPNPNCQAKAVRECLARAGVSADTISYVEAAASGSGMADAMEVAGLTDVFQGRDLPERCPIGSVKSNLGHAEAVSGMAQLAKVLLQLRHRQLVPSILAEPVNPRIVFEQTPFALQQGLTAWNRPVRRQDGRIEELPRRALINSFGAGGSYVSLIVEEFEASPASPDNLPDTSGLPQLIVLSAKTPERLRVVGQDLLAFLERDDQASLANVAYTLQVARQALEHRAATVVDTRAGLIDQLRRFVSHSGVGEAAQEASGWLQACVNAPSSRETRFLLGKLAPGAALSLPVQADLDRLGRYWTIGGEVDWRTMDRLGQVAIVDLPAYPFAPQRHWVVLHGSGARPEAADATHARPGPAHVPVDARDGGSSIEGELVALMSKILGIPAQQLDNSRPLIELGFTSIHAMSLQHGLAQAFGVELPLGLLADPQTSIGALVGSLAKDMPAAATGMAAAPGEEPAGLPGFPQLQVRDQDRDQPFPFTDIQEAFFAGRTLGAAMHSANAHIYAELVGGRELDIYKLSQSWSALIARHDMLRAVIVEGGQMRIQASTPPYKIGVVDLRRARSQGRAPVQALRDRMEAQVFSGSTWPMFEVAVSIGADRQCTIHVSMDEMIIDGPSFFKLLREWRSLYDADEAGLPALTLSFRDYALALKALCHTPRYQRDMAYWLQRLQDMPPAPQLLPARRASLTRGTVTAAGRSRLNNTLSPSEWSSIKRKATELGISPTVLVLTLFAEFLAGWSSNEAFSLVLTFHNRLPMHPQVGELIGPALSTSIFVVDAHCGEDLGLRARAFQEALWRDLDHATVSGVRALRELKARRMLPRNFALPVVFTSMLNNASDDDGSALGQPSWEIAHSANQTPQVHLDHQLFERDGALHFSWDVSRDSPQAALMDDMFDTYAAWLHGLGSGRVAWSRGSLPLKASAPDPKLPDLLPVGLRLATTREDSLRPFRLTDQQQAYAFGRNSFLNVSGNSCQFYQEFNLEALDLPRLECAWARLMMRHPMLRTVIHANGTQQLLDEVPTYRIPEHDLRETAGGDVEAALQAIRLAMVKRVAPLNQWPFFELRLSRIGARKLRLHVAIDMLIADGSSIALILGQLQDLYLEEDGVERVPVAPSVTFQDYIQAMENYAGSAGHERSQGYWQRRFEFLPDGPRLACERPAETPAGRHRRIEGLLKEWASLKARAAILGVPPSVILLTAYLEVLYRWNGRRPLAVVVPSWERLPLHPQIDQVVGDFTAMGWVSHTGQAMTFTERVMMTHQELSDDLMQRPVSGLSALRRATSVGRRGPRRSFPVVFTDHFMGGIPARPGFETGHAESKTPQVHLDNLSVERDDGLHCAWDSDGVTYPLAMLKSMFRDYLNLLDLLCTQQDIWSRPSLDDVISAKQEEPLLQPTFHESRV